MPSRNATTSSGATTRSSAKSQIVAMLKADHKKVKKAFKDFEKLDPQDEPEECQALVAQTCTDLEVHADLEEQVFYPAARQAIKEEDLLDEAEVEHMTAKVLIQQLKEMGPEDDKFAATFKVLGEYIDHHVQEEENEMFKQLTARGVDWDAVLEQMQQRRMELMQEKGLDPEAEAAEAPQATRTRSAAPASRGSRAPAESRPQASDARATTRKK